MSSIVVAGDTSGSVTLVAPAVAGSSVLTLPVATDTLVGKATTDTLTNKTLGSGTVMPTGSVLQVVNATYATEVITTSTAFVTTGLSASITPKFTTSKILILYTGTYYSSVASRGLKIQITRGATGIYAGNNYNLFSNAAIVAQQTLSYLDSPATTSATTYTINLATIDAVNVRAQYDNNQSNITLLEIAA